MLVWNRCQVWPNPSGISLEWPLEIRPSLVCKFKFKFKYFYCHNTNKSGTNVYVHTNNQTIIISNTIVRSFGEERKKPQGFMNSSSGNTSYTTVMVGANVQSVQGNHYYLSMILMLKWWYKTLCTKFMRLYHLFTEHSTSIKWKTVFDRSVKIGAWSEPTLNTFLPVFRKYCFWKLVLIPMFIIMFQISGLLYEIKVLLWSEFYMFGIQPIIFLPP